MQNKTKVFGFWVYLMTDLVIFAVLFATFIVLRNETYGGPNGKQLLDVSSALIETLILLTSSFTCSLGMRAIHKKNKTSAIAWFLITSFLGFSFLFIEISEFARLVNEEASWKRSAFLSSFFTLVGTHGLHISIGLLWMLVSILRIGVKHLNERNTVRIFCMTLFWHFLDVVWIFIFAVVYGISHLT